MILRHGLQNAKSCSWNPLYGVSPNHCLQKTLRVKLMDKRKRCKNLFGDQVYLWDQMMKRVCILHFHAVIPTYNYCIHSMLGWPVDKLMVALRTLYSKNHGKNTCASRKHPDPAVTKSCFLWLCNGYNARSQWARIDRQIKYHFVGVLALPLAMLAKQVKAFI